MKLTEFFIFLTIFINLLTAAHITSAEVAEKKKIAVVDSYHKGYRWSGLTNKGFCAALKKFGYIDNDSQINQFIEGDSVHTSRAVIKKFWLNSKKEKSKDQIAQQTSEITRQIEQFQPDILFLGDDNAAKYIGSFFLDTDLPIVFWGVNNTPVKYGLLDSKETPGHNVTGIYQAGYFAEGMQLLKKMVPAAKTFAILSDDSRTGTAMMKQVQFLARKGRIPLKLIASSSISDFEAWKENALELQKKVDAFFITQYNAIKDKDGNYLPNTEIAKWYITHINIPEAAPAGYFVKAGLLCSANDAGFNQGHDAVVIGHDILENRADPATYPARSPKRGPLIVNRQRAEMLDITLTDDMGIEQYIEKASVLVEVNKK